MKGILVVNHYLTGNKFLELYRWIASSARNHNINLSVLTNREIMIGLRNIPKDTDFVLFWDKDVTLAEYLETMGYKVFNSSNSIRICDDKAVTYANLVNHGINMPTTIVEPLSFGIVKELPEYISDVERTIGYPMIIKERCGSFGFGVYLVHNRDELNDIWNEHHSKGLIFQKYIKNSYGRDIRIHVVGDNVVTAMYRYNEDDFRANITNGALMKETSITKEQELIAIRATKIIGLDFAGVDILFGENDEPIICEVNSNAHFINIFNCTGVNVADYIFEYIIKHMS